MSDDFKSFAGTLPCTEHGYWNEAACPYCSKDREIALLKAELESTKAELEAAKHQVWVTKSEITAINQGACSMCNWMERTMCAEIREKLKAELNAANEKLRWRKWPEEAPTKDGMYLAKGYRGIESEYYDHSKGDGWQVFDYDYGAVIPWLPIPTPREVGDTQATEDKPTGDGDE